MFEEIQKRYQKAVAWAWTRPEPISDKEWAKWNTFPAPNAVTKVLDKVTGVFNKAIDKIADIKAPACMYRWEAKQNAIKKS